MNRQSRVRPERARRTDRSEESQKSPFVRLLRGAGIGVLLAFAVLLVLLLLASGLVFAQSDPDAFLMPAALVVLSVASLLCGVFAERISGTEPFSVGALAGALWIVLGALVSLALGDGAGAFSPVYAYALRIPAFLLVLLGAFLAKSRPRKLSSRRRR